MKSAETRDRIIQSALELFESKGYASTSMADLAERSEVLKGNLSYYFPTKAEVLKAVAEARSEELFGRLGRKMKPDMSAKACLHAFIDVFEETSTDLALHGCPVGSLCSELGRSAPELRPVATQVLRALSVWLGDQFSRDFRSKEAAKRAEYLLTLCQGAAILAHSFEDARIVVRQAEVAREWLESLYATNGAARSGRQVT